VRLASFGKDFYDDTNEAKYNNYVIYETSNAIGKKREDDLAGGQQAHLDYPEVTDTQKFNVHGDPITNYGIGFSSTPDGPIVGTPFIVLANTNYINKTAEEMGWQALVPFMKVINDSVVTVHYKVLKV
ncbi:MAG: hypothetical protein SH856_04325, partial [Flavobacteriales bacterium]|nr:hypothetical protein [Flavobacteriales bacterium]